jgi:hypothetical protein
MRRDRIFFVVAVVVQNKGSSIVFNVSIPIFGHFQVDAIKRHFYFKKDILNDKNDFECNGYE